MEDQTPDIHDWEVVLQEEDGELISKSSSSSITSAATSEVAEVAADEGGVIQSDYFTLDSHHQHNNDSCVGDGYTAATAAGRKRSRSPNSNSSESSSIEPHHDFNSPNELGMSSLGQPFTEEFHDAPEAEEGQQQQQQQQQHGVVVAEDDEVSRLQSEEESERQQKEDKRVVWWKVPMEVLRYCVMRVGPVWSLSVAAAAMMGLMILRRRYLYKLKRKAQEIQLKVTVDDDKTVSQFMTRAARLNEAFSVVKRVPIIRPALPALGMVPWPVVSMR